MSVPETPVDPRIDVIAKALFTGILFGNNAEDWDRLSETPTGWPRECKGWYRNGAEDVLQALNSPGWLAANIDMNASATIDLDRLEPEGEW